MNPKVIVITGASSGIGAALAIQLGALGHNLALAARREPELKMVTEKSGAQAISVTCDVTKRIQVEHLYRAAIEKFGHIDVWINNAGRGIGRSVLELTDDDLDEMISVNVKSALYGMQVAIPHFKERGRGHLINVSSFLGRVPFVPFRSAYSAAKAALNSLTANLRMELKPQFPEIQISVVMPGAVTTDFSKNALWGTPPFRLTNSRMKPQTAEEVAQVIVSFIENPKPEIYTNPASAEIALRYYQDVGAFENAM